MKEIVIRISDADYTHIIKSKWYFEASYKENPTDPAIRLGLATANGKVLPKGHGELKDSRIVDRFKDRIIAYGKDYTFSQEEVLNILGRYEGIYKKTYVEADKGDTE